MPGANTPRELPHAARPALALIDRLRERGYVALLAGGCVRDWLLGRPPEDYDVATNATPDEVGELFPSSRRVGAHFGVMLVRSHGRWVEVATFRSDGAYLDGRHPERVTFGDARRDALRRDFTINGMFLDPRSGEVSDYVGGQADLAAGLVRAIGEPRRRFDEDHLRLARAPRFAARLGFQIEPATLAAIRSAAPNLASVAAERVLQELERMLSHPTRKAAFQWLDDCGLLPYLWNGASWDERQKRAAADLLTRLPAQAPFTLAFAAMVADRPSAEIELIARKLAFSNEQRTRVKWLVEQQASLDDPASMPLADLKRRMAHPAFNELCGLVHARVAPLADGARRLALLTLRVEAISPESVAPAPLVSGDDLLARGVPAGPAYKRLLDDLYTRQLNEQLTDKQAALRALDEELRRGGGV